MKAVFCAMGALLILLLAGLGTWPALGSSEDETHSIKKVMDVLHKGARSPLNTVKGALKSQSPNWATVQKQAKVFASYGASLPKNDPPRGDKASFEKLATAYAAAAKTLEDAADKEDLEGSRDAFKKISTSCMSCHRNHRPN